MKKYFIACLLLSALPAYAQMAESTALSSLPEPVLDPNGQVIPYDGKKPAVETPPARKPAAKKSTKKKTKKPAKKKTAKTPKKTTQKAKP